MASAVIHLAIAKVLEGHFNIQDKKDYYLGSIAPDISKQIRENKIKSHFLFNMPDDIPNIRLFIEKYPKFMNNSFDLGYFIHLYTDKIWFSYFIKKVINGNYVRLLDGTIISTTPEECSALVYQDYTNLNIQVIDKYELDLSLFYEEFSLPTTDIEEIPIEKLNILIDKMGVIIENSKEDKAYVFDLFPIVNFIDEASQKILEFLGEINS